MKTFRILFVLIFFAPVAVHAQNFNDFKKKEEQKFKLFQQQKDSEEYHFQLGYKKYVQKADSEFVRFLKNRWKDFQAFKGRKAPLKPEPAKIPVYHPPIKNKPFPTQKILPLPVKNIPKQIPTHKQLPAFKPVPKPVIVTKPVIKTPENPNLITLNCDFFGRTLNFQLDKKITQKWPPTISKQALGQWWAAVSKTNYTPLMVQLMKTKKELNLNDWAYFLLVQKLSEKASPDNSGNARLLTWFLMIRSGYNIKIALSDGSVYLLFPSNNIIYGRKYLMIQDRPFYLAETPRINSFQSYDFNFPGVRGLVNLNVPEPLDIGNRTARKVFNFSYKGKRYSLPVLLNTDNLKFMRNYPLTNLTVFFDASMSSQTKQSVLKGLKPIITGMNKKEALNFLLSFVQKTFTYETDEQLFGREKYFFPEEVFYYKGSNCKDRAVLFSWLTRHLLGMKVIGLKYSNHVATAVLLGEDIPGDYIIYNHKKYIMADPTYIGAPLGLAMPAYRNVRPEVVPVN